MELAPSADSGVEVMAEQSVGLIAASSESLVLVQLDKNFDLVVRFDVYVFGILLALVIAVVLFWCFRWGLFRRVRSFEIEEAELGLGSQKITLRPNESDRQIAYKIWVELSTRKIGLEIDLNDDVIYEIYDSWYSFFSVTRELLKDVPASKFSRSETKQIIDLTIRVLNEGIRPHLTKWQARFRRWYERELERDENGTLSPQDIQKKYQEFDSLSDDLIEVNSRLIAFRHQMHRALVGEN